MNILRDDLPVAQDFSQIACLLQVRAGNGQCVPVNFECEEALASRHFERGLSAVKQGGFQLRHYRRLGSDRPQRAVYQCARAVQPTAKPPIGH